MVIKSTAQETEKLIEETEKIKANLKEACVKHAAGDAYDEMSYTIEHPTEWVILSTTTKGLKNLLETRLAYVNIHFRIGRC